jgi:hypothetical protein
MLFHKIRFQQTNQNTQTQETQKHSSNNKEELRNEYNNASKVFWEDPFGYLGDLWKQLWEWISQSFKGQKKQENIEQKAEEIGLANLLKTPGMPVISEDQFNIPKNENLTGKIIVLNNKFYRIGGQIFDKKTAESRSEVQVMQIEQDPNKIKGSKEYYPKQKVIFAPGKFQHSNNFAHNGNVMSVKGDLLGGFSNGIFDTRDREYFGALNPSSYMDRYEYYTLEEITEKDLKK